MTFEFNPSSTLKKLLIEPDKPFLYRDLSSIQFNERVLEEALLTTNPLLERIKFLSICSSNLDEFFMIRVASIGRSIASNLRHRRKNKFQKFTKTRSHLMSAVAHFVRHIEEGLFSLSRELDLAHVHMVFDSKDSEKWMVLARKVFSEKILPELEPPTPFTLSHITNLENLQMAVLFENGMWFKIPKKIKSVFCVSSDDETSATFYFLDHLLETFLAEAFGLKSKPTFLRLTRDGDLNVDLEEEDPEAIPDIVRTSLTKREKGRPVRFQYMGHLSSEKLEELLRLLKLPLQQAFHYKHTLCLHGLWSALNDIPTSISQKSHMQHPTLKPLLPNPFQKGSHIFDFLKQKDILLHHPYDDFEAYVEWIRAACLDPEVIKIEQTVYRMDALSPVIALLKSHASQKKIRVVIELRARFDEFNNLSLADDLRNAGVEVAFGFGKLKIHAKVALVTRKEQNKEVLYTHLSTGNYNAITARQYTDLSILTAHPDIGKDAHHFFDSIFHGKTPHTFKQLVPAPTDLHRKLLSLIKSEIAAAKAGKPARIVSKVNALVDSTIINTLYSASQAGVKIDLIVRGACSLIPQIPGLSDNIQVISIIDRFLEHSRIYYFEHSQTMYLSSADWMPRNFFSRSELAFPVLDPKIYSYIKEVVFPAYLNDRTKAKELTPDGIWKTRTPSLENLLPLRSQFYFEELSQKRYQGTSLE